ncbi:MAG: N-acetyltransferase family protein [Pyrinomonadaceae bacterium]
MMETVEMMRAGDWETVRAIYLEGIATGHAAFETEGSELCGVGRGALIFQARCPRKRRRRSERVGGSCAGFSRCVYGGVAEVSVYVSEAHRGEGLGKALLSALIEASEANGIWCLQAGVFPENTASIFLHQLSGFREVGRRERIGKMNRKWRDTVLLERRSGVVGVE